MMPTILSLDVGTSKLCALALDVESRCLLATRSAPNSADVADLPNGFHEQNPIAVRDRTLELLRDLLDDAAVRAEAVAAVSITGQMHGVLLVDAALRPITNLITWRDQRVLQPNTPGNLHDALQAIPLDFSRRTGCRLHAGYGGATLHHLACNEGIPENATALTIADFIAASLTGVVATEPTHAASWGLLDLQTLQWDVELLQGLHLPQTVLPPLRPTSSALGPLRSEMAEFLGLPKKTLVCLPIGDNQASFVGVAGFDRDIAVVNLGTGGQVSIPHDQIVSTDGFETRPMPFSGYLLVGASLCGGWAYSYLRRFFQEAVRQFAGVELDDEHLYQVMNRLAVASPENAEGIVVDTRFSGTRGSPGVRGAIAGIGVDNLAVGNLSRAFVEGMVRELADLFHAVEHRNVARIAAGGNAVSKNPLVAQAIETLFGRKCCKSTCREEAAVGAAYAAAVALNLVPSQTITNLLTPA